MSILHAIVFGIVEGLTEFLPVSSTFHLIMTAKLLGLQETDFIKMFEVVIQAGAIGALLFMYTKTLISNRKLLTNVIASFIPTAGVGLVLYKIIKSIFFTTDGLMMWMFVSVALIFFVIEYLVSHKKLTLTKYLGTLSLKESILIGLAQSIAVIPGVSRSGAVIVAMMAYGYRRDEAAKYTFLLSMPTIFAASALDLYKSRALLGDASNNATVLLVGFGVSFLVAYAVVKWFLSYLKSHSLTVFAWYRLIAAAIFLIIFSRY
jgi:undecaprenyl-diphosphatase